MRHFGVVYDVGLRYFGNRFSFHEPFPLELVRHDMRVIADELHANAVRIEGEHVDRLVAAGRAAHTAGLAVWLSPWKMDAGVEETRDYLVAAAKAAEQLRLEGAKVVLVVSCEYSIFCDGVFPGDSILERSAKVREALGPAGWPTTPKHLPEPFTEKTALLNDLLRSLIEAVRPHFAGPLTYSAAIFEDVDWTMFDFAGPNYYRENETDEEYIAGLDFFRTFDRPIVIPEFGCCTYEGAAARGGRGWRIQQGTTSTGEGIFEGGVVPVRSEREQADYLERQFRIYAEHDVYAAFAFLFSFPLRRFDVGARDMDMISFSLVKYFPSGDPRNDAMPPWEPKASFHRLAKVFAELSAAAAD